jgi:two-component system repressor protein LuxO
VRAGRFREDLYYRLHVVPIHMPPLRERGEDVIEIAERLLADMAREEGRGFAGLSPEVADIFRSLPWPGNVRQLINVLRNVVVLNDGPLVLPEMLPQDLSGVSERAGSLSADPSAELSPAPTQAPALSDLAGRTLAQIERMVIEAAIARNGGSIPRAAQELDVSPSTIYRKREAWEKADREV